MKKLIISAAIGLVLPLLSMGQTTLGPGVTGSSLMVSGLPHNFAVQSWNTYVNAGLGGQICQPCHTPHNAQGSAPAMGAPLWNHQLTSAGFTLFSSINTTAGTMGVAAIDGTSKLCLSCHDGSIALGAFGGQTGGTAMGGYDGGLANVGTDLSNDHPISIDYTNCVTNKWGGLNATTYVYYTSYDAVAASYNYGTAGSSSSTVQGKLDANNKVQCTSCHGAHSNSKGYQLGMNNQGSLLCLVCHKK